MCNGERNEPDPTDIDALIDRTGGSRPAKKQAKVILRTIAGKLLDKEACLELGVRQTELDRLRKDYLRGLVRGAGMPIDPSAN